MDNCRRLVIGNTDAISKALKRNCSEKVAALGDVVDIANIVEASNFHVAYEKDGVRIHIDMEGGDGDELRFVIREFKGGGMPSVFRHLVDISELL